MAILFKAGGYYDTKTGRYVSYAKGRQAATQERYVREHLIKKEYHPQQGTTYKPAPSLPTYPAKGQQRLTPHERHAHLFRYTVGISGYKGFGKKARVTIKCFVIFRFELSDRQKRIVENKLKEFLTQHVHEMLYDEGEDSTFDAIEEEEILSDEVTSMDRAHIGKIRGPIEE